MNYELPGEQSRPWLSMAYMPRRTIRQIVAADPKRSLAFVASLTGIATLLGQMESSHAGDHLILSLLLVIAVAGGAVLGIVLNSWLGWLVHWVGSKLGGHGTVDSVRAAYAWSFVPTFWALVLWLPAIAIFGSGLFSGTISPFQADALRSIAYLGFLMLRVIAGIWSLVLLIASISEVEGFSIWRALLTFALSCLIIFAMLFLGGALIEGLHFVPRATSG